MSLRKIEHKNAETSDTKVDARPLSKKVLDALRKRGIDLLKEDVSQTEGARCFKVLRQRVIHGGKRMRELPGDQAYLSAKPSHKEQPRKSRRILTKRQQQVAHHGIIDKDLAQLQVEFALWPRKPIKLLMLRLCQMEWVTITQRWYWKAWRMSA